MTSPTERELSQSLHDLVSTQPFVPDLAAIERRGRRLQRRSTVGRAAAGFGVAAAVTAVAIGVNGTVGENAVHPSRSGSVATSAPTTGTPAAKSAVVTNLPLMRLANSIKATKVHETGDATLVLRDQKYPNGTSYTGADLYTDAGEYFYSETESGLPAQIKANDNEGDGFMKRELAAAVYAAAGNLQEARHRMAIASYDPGVKPESRSEVIAALRKQVNSLPSAAQRAALGKRIAVIEHAHVSKVSQTDNMIWENSLDALIAGADNPEVRAGVLRLLSTMKEVSVKNTTTDGQQSLTITAGAPALPKDYQEQLTINAETGVPLGFVGGNIGQTPGVTVSYQVSRVEVSAIEAGQF